MLAVAKEMVLKLAGALVHGRPESWPFTSCVMTV